MLGRKTIYKALNIEDGEATPVFLMILQTIFIGVFYGTFDLTAHTLFLKHYPEAMISKGYVVSGMLGIIMTATFSKVQSKMKFATLSKFTFFFISACTLVLWTLFQISAQNWVVFLAFILLGPLNIVAGLTFWGTAGRIFNLRQGKRLFGIVDSGQIFGIILSSYAIPFILQFLNGTHNLFLISGLSIFGALVVEAVLTHKYQIDSTDTDAKEAGAEETEQTQVGFIGIMKAPYLRYMALFVAFSMFTAFFVQFSFLCVTNEKYPEEASLASFLGFFTGTMTIVTFLVKTFVYGKLMKSYGLKICLLLSSLLLLLFTGIAIVAGSFGGYTVAAGGGFIYFFMLISLSRLFNQTLKGALEGPAFKLLYQSISKKIRFDVQAKVDGTVNEFSALFSGILLSALGALSFIKLIHYSVATFIILATWAYITFRLYREYRNSLDQALGQDEETGSANENSSSEKLTVESLLHIRKNAPSRYQSAISRFVEQNSPSASVADKSDMLLVDIAGLHHAKKLPAEWVRFYENLASADKSSYTAKEFSDMIVNGGSENIAKVFNAMARQDMSARTLTLIALLRSHYANVQKLALAISGYLGNTELLGTFTEFVDVEDLSSDAIVAMYNAVASVTEQKGKEQLSQQLIQLFYKSNVTLLVQQVLLDLMSIVKTDSAKEFLISNFAYHKSEIVYQTVSLLRKMSYQASDAERQRFFHPITEAAQIISWDYAAIESLKAAEVQSPLLPALEAEQKRHMSYLLNLLSITYKAQSVKNIKDNLDLGGEGTSYALELFDMLLSEEIKPVVVSVFDELPVAEKMEILQGHFPVELISVPQLILNILDRDPNYMSKYTKQIALLEYPKYWTEVTDNLLAQMFSPVVDLQLRAASVVANLDIDVYRKALVRLDVRSKKIVEQYVKENSQKTFDIVSAINVFKHKAGIDNIDNVEFSSFVESGFVRNENGSFLDKYYALLVVDSFGPDNADMPSTFMIDKQVFDNNVEVQTGKMFVGIRKRMVNPISINNIEISTGLINRLS